MSFLEKFDKEFAPKLARRAKTFRRIFEELEKKNSGFYVIAETGCVRSPNGWSGDGMSTVLFDKFVNYHYGGVSSVDISTSACKNARKLVSPHTVVHNQDSITYMKDYVLTSRIDLLYLDSFDINFSKPHPSALHHMKEFAVVFAKLATGTIVVVDDQQGKVGKGMYIAEFLEGLGYERFIDDYQIGWIL